MVVYNGNNKLNLVPREIRSPSYGGLIHHLEIDDLLIDISEGNKEIDFQKVKEIFWKLAFDSDYDFGDKDDPGDKLFYNLYL